MVEQACRAARTALPSDPRTALAAQIISGTACEALARRVAPGARLRARRHGSQPGRQARAIQESTARGTRKQPSRASRAPHASERDSAPCHAPSRAHATHVGAKARAHAPAFAPAGAHAALQLTFPQLCRARDARARLLHAPDRARSRSLGLALSPLACAAAAGWSASAARLLSSAARLLAQADRIHSQSTRARAGVESCATREGCALCARPLRCCVCAPARGQRGEHPTWLVRLPGRQAAAGRGGEGVGVCRVATSMSGSKVPPCGLTFSQGTCQRVSTAEIYC